MHFYWRANMQSASPRDSLSSATVRMHLAKMSVRPSTKGMYRLVPAPMAKKAIEAEMDAAAEAAESATPENTATSTVSKRKEKRKK